MEKTLHYAHPTGVALAVTSGVVYIICVIAVTLWPAQAVQFFADWFHAIDLTKLFVIPQITLLKFLRGLIGIMLFAYLAGAVYAWAYNACVAHCKKRRWI